MGRRVPLPGHRLSACSKDLSRGWKERLPASGHPAPLAARSSPPVRRRFQVDEMRRNGWRKMRRNQWTTSVGMGGRNESESALRQPTGMSTLLYLKYTAVDICRLNGSAAFIEEDELDVKTVVVGAPPGAVRAGRAQKTVIRTEIVARAGVSPPTPLTAHSVGQPIRGSRRRRTTIPRPCSQRGSREVG